MPDALSGIRQAIGSGLPVAGIQPITGRFVGFINRIRYELYTPSQRQFAASDGRPFTSEDSERIASELSEAMGSYRAGSATLKRAALFNTFLRESGSDGRRHLLGALVNQLQGRGLVQALNTRAINIFKTVSRNLNKTQEHTMLNLSEKTKQALAKATPEQREQAMKIAREVLANRARKMMQERAKLKAKK